MSNQSIVSDMVEAAGVKAVPKNTTGNLDDREYRLFLWRLDARFYELTGPLFTTDADVWSAYIESFPESARQFHNCNCCRAFLRRYGALATIDSGGDVQSALWVGVIADSDHDAALAAMCKAVRSAKVTGVFLTTENVLGNATTGIWRHLSLSVPERARFRHALLSADQAMASKREDFGTVSSALSELKLGTLEQAVHILKSDALYRSEKVLGQAEWLRDLKDAAYDARWSRKPNLVWRAIATAPDGYCHPRSSMIGTLLEDLEAGLPFDDVARKFAAKMNPLAYQRPQAPPTAGNIAQAEKIVEKLGIAPSLERRFARLDELQETLWKPAAEPERAPGGVFGHLKPKGTAEPSSVTLPSQNITWEKFARTVLPDAKAVEVLAPYIGNYVAILTASNPEAPPILQWDSLERRNPFSVYVYHGGSQAGQWGLAPGTWVPVTAITLRPSAWHGNTATHNGSGVLLLLDGAKDSRDNSGNALFPESLRAELREVRSTIESYSKTAKIGGREEASACGVLVSDNSPARVRVTLGSGVRAEYQIDRLD